MYEEKRDLAASGTYGSSTLSLSSWVSTGASVGNNKKLNPDLWQMRFVSEVTCPFESLWEIYRATTRELMGGRSWCIPQEVICDRLGHDPVTYGLSVTVHTHIKPRLVADAIRVRGHVPPRELRTRLGTPLHHGVGQRPVRPPPCEIAFSFVCKYSW